MGIVSCLGHGVEQFAQGLFGGRSGLSEIDRFDASGLRNALMGVVRDLPARPVWLPEDVPGYRDLAYLSAATAEALESAGLGPQLGTPATGCVVSTNFACGEAIAEAQAHPGNGAAFAYTRFDAGVMVLARALGVTGPCECVSISCASGTAAVGVACDLIRRGRAERVIAGGYDALSLFTQAGLSCLRTISTDTVRPFSRNRSQTIFGEGAAIFVLEALDCAAGRHAPIRAEILGHGLNNNAYHLTAPDKEGEGITAGIRMAVLDAGIDPARIDYVNAHGTGTEYHDVTEVKAIKNVLGARAYEIPVSSTKGATGHTMGAAGSMEILASILAIERGEAPPTLNLDEPDPECDLNHVPYMSQPASIQVVLSNSAGIGGGNASIILAAPGWLDSERGGGSR
jgi:3-oxoacyl-(acyl-carrier-protein) synthase